MKKILLTLTLSVFAVSLSLASVTPVTIDNQSTVVEYEMEKDSCEKDCKKACCKKDATSKKACTAKGKKACSKKGKACCKGGKAEASTSTENAKPAKKACCAKGKKKCAKVEPKPADQPQPLN